MSIYLPECNANIQGSSGAVVLGLPAAASYKPSNTGFVIGAFVRAIRGGYEINGPHSVFTRGGGLTGGNDAYLQLNQGATTLTARVRNGGSDLLGITTLSGLPGSGVGMLVMLIATATNAHVVACVPGSAPLVMSVANTALYGANLSAADLWTRIGAGTGANYGHYGEIEEAFHLHGLFPESGGVPDATLIQNIASGAQALSTLHTQLTSGVRKWRYRMLRQDDLSDAFGIAGALTPVNTSVDKLLLSGGPLRPAALRPAATASCPSQVQFGTPGDAATAFANIKVEGGTYIGISPAAIQARLRKEDGSVLRDWTVMDAAPAGGNWAAGQFTAVPMTAGDLTCEFRAVDGSGVQIGDHVASHGLKGAGFNILMCSQSQGIQLFGNGTGVAIPSAMRSQFTWLSPGWRVKKLSSLNAISRVARGMRQAAMEIHALFPGVPVHFATVGITGEPIQQFITGGAYAGNWASFKTLMGIVQPYLLFPIGHSSAADSNYGTYLGALVTKAGTDVGTPLGVAHSTTARYAGSGTGANHIAAMAARDAIRARIEANPTENLGAVHNVVKCDAGDTGPHPLDADVGQGRSGALIAWGAMMWARAVEDRQLTLVAAQKINGGAQDKLVFGRADG